MHPWSQSAFRGRIQRPGLGDQDSYSIVPTSRDAASRVATSTRMPTTNRSAAAAPGARATYSISDLAREFALTTRAIRFYEDCGLLAPRRDKRTRVYGERERVRLKLI